MLFTVVSGSPNPDWDRARIVVQSIRTGERRVVMEGATDGRYLSTGHLVYAVGGALQAARFDLATSRIVGTPVTVLSGVRRAISVGSLRAEALAVIAENGTLAYVPGPAAFPMSRTIAVIDRDGHERLLPIPPGPYESPRISPDGRFLAYGSVDGRDATIWVYELSGQGAPRRLTFTGNNRYPVWSPDSRRLAFQSDRDAETGIFVQNADGTGQAERLTLAEPGAIHFPESWARVGDRLSFSVLTSSGSALWTVSVAGKEATPFGGVTGIGPHNSAVSPDGGWIAYTSRSEPNGVFVQPVPATGARYQISSTSEIGHHPFWSPDGKELFYLGAERGGLLVGVTLVVANGVTAGKSTVFPRALAANTNATGPSNYDITRDGRSFVGIRGASEALNSPATEIHVVLNWLDELRRLVPVP